MTHISDSIRRTRRTSAQTDISNHTEEESESEASMSESEDHSRSEELSRTRSGVKPEEPELKTYKRKSSKPPVLVRAQNNETDRNISRLGTSPNVTRSNLKSWQRSLNVRMFSFGNSQIVHIFFNIDSYN